MCNSILAQVGNISIHVPRAGYDKLATLYTIKNQIFLSTYPVRGTTEYGESSYPAYAISIHVPRAGYDNYWKV